VAASEYAHLYPETDVYVIDLCPQANVSETLLVDPTILRSLISRKPRATVAGYLEARLNSPFRMIKDVSPYICRPSEFNDDLPENLLLVCGDNFLEIISEAIRQTSQLAIPIDTWSQVLNWIRDLTVRLRENSGDRDAIFMIDCNPSFAIYTQLALVAAEHVVVPFTADERSRRAIENVVALLYGYGTRKRDAKIRIYAPLNFSKSAKAQGVNIPKLHTFVGHRATRYMEKASREAVSTTIKETMDQLHKRHRQIYANPKELPSQHFIEIPDYHSACVVATTTGTPLYKLKPGPRDFLGTRVQLNKEPLEQYRDALAKFVSCL
jgi:cellulose biosynthesis protein BcsQ